MSVIIEGVADENLDNEEKGNFKGGVLVEQSKKTYNFFDFNVNNIVARMQLYGKHFRENTEQ